MTETEILLSSASLALFVIAALIMIIGTCTRSEHPEGYVGRNPKDLR